jgi:16S rRNA (guanine966-N2)-methyltransferase
VIRKLLDGCQHSIRRWGVRIIAGTARGRSIDAPRGTTTRPTSDRVREALFSAIEARLSLDGAEVLDLYAGTGALGLEAVSRGARRCVAVDHAHPCARLIAGNAARLGLAEAMTIVELEVEAALERLTVERASFDLVLLDPPYSESATGALEQLGRAELLRPGGLTVLEHSSRHSPCATHGVLHAMLSKRYGDTGLTFYTREGE